MKAQYNKGLKLISIATGDLVLLYDGRFAKFPGKLFTRWLGSYRVVQLYPNGSAQLADLLGEVYPTRIHYDRLKKY